MSDLALTYQNGIIDLDFGDGGAALDDGLRTAVIVSLFSDRLAGESDILPADGEDRRGWWGDVYPGVAGDLTGSLLWLLSREKDLASVRRRAEGYARDALQWMVDDGEATRVEVSAEDAGKGVLALSVRIKSLRWQDQEYQFNIASGTVVSGSVQELSLLDESGLAILDETGGDVLAES